MKRHIVISALVIGLVGLSSTAWAGHHGGGHAAAHVGHSGGPAKVAHHMPHAPTHINVPHKPSAPHGNVHHEGNMHHAPAVGAGHGNAGVGHGFNSHPGHGAVSGGNHGVVGNHGFAGGAHHTSRVHHRTHERYAFNNNAYRHRYGGNWGGYGNRSWLNQLPLGTNGNSSLSGLAGTNRLGGLSPMQQVNNDLAQLNMAARSGNMAAVRRDERALSAAEMRLHGGTGGLASAPSRTSNVHHDVHNDWRSQRIDRDHLHLARMHQPASSSASKPSGLGAGSKPTAKTIGASAAK